MITKLGAVVAIGFSTVGIAAEVVAVSTLDVPRYLGKWYEIASFPQVFETGCTNTTANYSANADGSITVQNECRFLFSGGPKISISGVATAPDLSQLSKLKVSFFGGQGADYWVLSVDYDYRYALVGDPTRKTLWVLSRTPRLESDAFKALVATAREQGFDVDKLRFTKQGSES